MTTVPEIRKLVRPLVERYPDMVQAGRFLLFRPLGHLMRTLAFWGGSSRYNFNPHWLLCPLSMPPGLMNTFGRDIPVGYSNWPGFSEIFYERTAQGIEQYLVPTRTLREFHDLGWKPEVFFEGDFSHFP